MCIIVDVVDVVFLRLDKNALNFKASEHVDLTIFRS